MRTIIQLCIMNIIIIYVQLENIYYSKMIVDECPYYLYANSESQECEECADGKFKDKNKNECTESIPDGNVQIQVIVIEDDEEKEKDYKVYDKCYETCLHCNKPSDDENNQECKIKYKKWCEINQQKN